MKCSSLDCGVQSSERDPGVIWCLQRWVVEGIHGLSRAAQGELVVPGPTSWSWLLTDTRFPAAVSRVAKREGLDSREGFIKLVGFFFLYIWNLLLSCFDPFYKFPELIRQHSGDTKTYSILFVVVTSFALDSGGSDQEWRVSQSR